MLAGAAFARAGITRRHRRDVWPLGESASCRFQRHAIARGENSRTITERGVHRAYTLCPPGPKKKFELDCIPTGLYPFRAMKATALRKPEKTRRKILEAAFAEFYKNGFQGGSINHIVEEAGATKGALFHHFKGKNDLGYAVVREVIQPQLKARWSDP